MGRAHENEIKRERSDILIGEKENEAFSVAERIDFLFKDFNTARIRGGRS